MEPTTVEILESSFVVPSVDTPSEILVLSNLDLVAYHKHNCTLYLYQNTYVAHDFFSVEVLKSALAKALVLLYPVAGRQVVGHDGRDQIVCNAEGVLFVVAKLDRTADSMKFEPMSQELIELFFPKEKQLSSLIMLQVTYLKCGSVVLTGSISHITIDGRSSSYFYQTWSRIVRGDLKNIIPPSFDKTPLRARSPPKISFNFPEYTADQPNKGDTSDPCVLSLLRLSKEQISHLKIRCSQGGNATKVSTFSAVSALVWKCYCIAKGLAPDMMRVSAVSEVSKIISNPISNVASTVKAVIDGVTDEYIRSFIDYVEVNSDKKFSAREPSEESDLRIRSILGTALSDVDFGWGAPQLYSWERIEENRVIYIVNELGKIGCIKVVAALDSSIMQQFNKVFYEELLFGRSLL